MGSACSLEGNETLTRRGGVRTVWLSSEPEEHEMNHGHRREISRSKPFLPKPSTVCTLLPMYFDSICELTFFYCGFVGHA